MLTFVCEDKKNMSNGKRDYSKTPLTEEEIEFVKSEIRRIGADETVFVFNDKEYIDKSTCYNFIVDKIFVTRNVFPDFKYGSTHPRDLMSVGAVLAHEYYGHRPYRQEYIQDREISIGLGEKYHTTPIWKDECRASINASKLAPNLSDKDRSYLVSDAIYRAQEEGQLIEIDDYMKEVLYGYSISERNITPTITPIIFVSETSQEGKEVDGGNTSNMPKMSRKARNHDIYER